MYKHTHACKYNQKGGDSKDLPAAVMGVSDEVPGFSDRRRRRSMSEDDSDDEGTYLID
jgi:hypothetical protein